MSKKFIIIAASAIILLGVANFFIADSGFLNRQPVNSSPSSNAKGNSTNLSPISCSKEPLKDAIEGPYYTKGSPQKTDLTEEGMEGERVTLTGYVVNTSCQPIANAWLDFWQADSKGEYDNTGYRLRGHQYTDKEGKYTLTTVVPGEYPGRTPHIHVKVRASESSPIITTQLFFPELTQNQGDFVYDKSLEVKWVDSNVGRNATYDFVVRDQ